MHLWHADHTIVARNFALAVGKQETGVVREEVTGWSEECERRTVGAVETEKRAFLPVCCYGSVYQVLVGQLAFPTVLETGDVLMCPS